MKIMILDNDMLSIMHVIVISSATHANLTSITDLHMTWNTHEMMLNGVKNTENGNVNNGVGINDKDNTI